MKGIVYRSAALALACIVALSVLAVPSFATDYQSTYNFWNWAYDNSWFLGKAIIGFSAGNVCQVSEDGLHHATTHSGGGGSVDGQRVYNCVCDLCGNSFTAVATDLQQTYYKTVDDTDINSVDNDGSYYIHPDWVIVALESYWSIEFIDYDTAVLTKLKHYSSSNETSGHMSCLIDLPYESTVYIGEYSITTECGHYVNQRYGTSYRTSDDGDSFTLSKQSFGATIDVNRYLELTCRYYVKDCLRSSGVPVGGTVIYHIDFPDICVTPKDNVAPDTLYRPFNFAPSFSYTDENGESVTVSDNNIIDEENLTYYNPVTNTTTNIQNWSYDYSDRSYTCTTENNTTTTITYGDEYITINEGDVNNTYITYNIYYYTAPENSGDGSGSGSDGEGSGSSGSGDNSDDGDGIVGGLGELLGSLLGGLIDLITGLISGLIDSLINLVEMTIEKLGQVVNLFGEFGDALKVLWSWLPDEVVTILAAGVSVVVFASVIKLFV